MNRLVETVEYLANDRPTRCLVIGGIFCLIGEAIYIFGNNNISFNLCSPNGYKVAFNQQV